MSQIGLTSFGKSRTGVVIDGAIAAKPDLLAKADLFDCYAVFSYIAVRELRLRGPSSDYFELEQITQRLHKKIVASRWLNDLFADFGLNVISDIVPVGKRLASIEFRDF